MSSRFDLPCNRKDRANGQKTQVTKQTNRRLKSSPTHPKGEIMWWKAGIIIIHLIHTSSPENFSAISYYLARKKLYFGKIDWFLAKRTAIKFKYYFSSISNQLSEWKIPWDFFSFHKTERDEHKETETDIKSVALFQESQWQAFPE
jgi:hypothetical protein